MLQIQLIFIQFSIDPSQKAHRNNSTINIYDKQCIDSNRDGESNSIQYIEYLRNVSNKSSRASNNYV